MVKIEKLSSKCLLHDGSVFIGLTSLPLGKEKEMKKDLDSLFENTKNGLLKKVNQIKNDDFDDLKSKFYNPKYYYLFGQFDLAAISLVEGFNFPVRQFNFNKFYENASCKELTFSRHSNFRSSSKIQRRK